MEQLNAKLLDKYTALKKRKLLDEGAELKRGDDIKEMFQAMKEFSSELENLKNENDRLSKQLNDMEQEIAGTRFRLVEETLKRKEVEGEILMLQCLLAEKNETNNSVAPVSPEAAPQGNVHNQTPISRAKRTPKLNSKANKVRSIENTIVPQSGFQDEARELDCCRRQMRISGGGTGERCSACVYHMLAESLVGMRFSLKNEMEGFSLSVHHEASGYNFTLTWIEQPDGGEWSYQHSSLGTLDRIAVAWMKQDIRFSMSMCPKFFERISHIVRQG